MFGNFFRKRIKEPMAKYLDNVGVDIPETLKRSGLFGLIPRSRLVTILFLLRSYSITKRDKKVREAYLDAYNILKGTLTLRLKTEK